jgi:geranylgeranyl reductase
MVRHALGGQQRRGQQVKLTLLTLGSVLRGQALAPSGYQPVPSAVRSEAEVSALLNDSTPPTPAPRAGQNGVGNGGNPGTSKEEREPILAGR